LGNFAHNKKPLDLHMFLAPDFYKDPESLIFLIFVFVTLLQLFYHWFYFARVAFVRIRDYSSASVSQPVSVIICAKNEYHNLKDNLHLILEQDYPNFEVILVNDFSEDDSYFLLKSLEEKYPNFKVIHLRENVNFFEGKKLALAVGIKSAKNDLILLTDADCRPAGRNWIKSMTAGFAGNCEVVLGYGGYNKLPGLLNNLIRFDTISIALQYMGMAKAGSPYMGVGRNLAYKKSLFFKTGGFTSHYKIKSGDDDLFINMASNAKNTVVAIHPDSFTWSKPKTNFASWFAQKKRHLSTGKYYKAMDKFRLGLWALSGNLFYITFILFLFLAKTPEILIAGLSFFMIRTISLIILHYYAGKKLSEKKLFIYSPMFDIIMVLLNPVFALSNLFYRKNKWK
jgi:glycosyltransferase involved in cell wall biosynthesis